MWRLVAVIVVCVGVASAMPSTAATRAPIQPGAILTRPDVEPLHGAAPYTFMRCTMSFVFRDAHGDLYTGTAGESDCAQKPGGAAFDGNGERIGRVLFRECGAGSGVVPVVQECGTDTTSFMLIRIDRSRWKDVDPSVRGWGGPTGVASSGDVHAGDVVLFTGNAFVEGDLPATQPRVGVLLSYDARHFTADTLATLGDSGGPVIDAVNGLAIGIVSDFGQANVPPTTDDGPSVPAIVAAAASRGIRLTLVTAPYATTLGTGSPSPQPSSASPSPHPMARVSGVHRTASGSLPGTGLADPALTVAAMMLLAAAAAVARVSRIGGAETSRPRSPGGASAASR
jgi:hypothetical protein